MNGNNLVHAFTNPGIDAPPYINITRMNDGSVRVIVRGVGTEEITMSAATSSPIGSPLRPPPPTPRSSSRDDVH